MEDVEPCLKFSMLTLLAIADRLVDLLNLLLLPGIIYNEALLVFVTNSEKTQVPAMIFSSSNLSRTMTSPSSSLLLEVSPDNNNDKETFIYTDSSLTKPIARKFT